MLYLVEKMMLIFLNGSAQKMSKTFWVDFSGYCEIEAETAEEAEQKFWDFINENIPLPQNIYNVDGVEEKTE